MDKSLALKIFTALGQSTRMDVVRTLVQAGDAGMAAGAISSHLDVSHNLLSSHLTRLESANLVASERQGRMIIYRVRFDTLRGVLAFLLHDCCQGHPAILKDILS